MRIFIVRSLLGLAVALAIAIGAIAAFGNSGESSIGPVIGDHWHATYEIWVCGQRLPHLRLWEGGVHTHDDGFIHSHPIHSSEQGMGASLESWFEYGDGKLTRNSLKIPGTNTTLTNGDLCPDGSSGKVRVSVNGENRDRWSRYIPQHEDHIVIVFGTGN
jgi:hypothetical protein